MELVISGVGVFGHAGEGPDGLRALRAGAPTPAAELIEEGLERPVGRLGRIRNHPFARRYRRFGQIDTFSRYAFVAAGHALDDAGLTAPDPAWEGMGVIVGTAFGCQEANWQFDQFSLDPAVGLRGASPLAFKGTVDNAPAGWIAVGYGLRGVNATFVSGPGAGGEALLAACRAVEAGRTPAVLTGGVERLIRLQLAALERGDAAPRPYPAEGAAIVVVERADHARARGHTPRARLRMAAQLAVATPGALRASLTDAGVDPGALGRVLLAGGDVGAVTTLVGRAGIEAPVEDSAERTGQSFAAQAPLAVGLAVADAGAAPALIWVPGEANDVTALVVDVATSRPRG